MFVVVFFLFVCLFVCLFFAFFCFVLFCFVSFCFVFGVNAANTKLDVPKKCHISLHGDGLDMSFVCLAVTASVSKSTDPDLITSLLPLHHSYPYITFTFTSLLPLHHPYLYITLTVTSLLPLHHSYLYITLTFTLQCANRRIPSRLFVCSFINLLVHLFCLFFVS